MKTMNNIEFAQVIVEELSKIMPDYPQAEEKALEILAKI